MPIPIPSNGETQDKFISRCMSADGMLKEFPDQKQRSGVCFSQFRKGKKKSRKESIFCNVRGFETKENKNGDLIKCGYIATTHLDSGFLDEERDVWIKDKIAKETLQHWAEEINDGVPRANKVSVNHNRDRHVAGAGIKGSAKVEELPDGEFGLYAETVIDKTKENFEDTNYRIDKGFLDSFSIEFTSVDPMTGNYFEDAVVETKVDNGIVRTLYPGVELDGWTLGSQPMNEHAIMLKEIKEVNKMTEKEVKGKKEEEVAEPKEEEKVEGPKEEDTTEAKEFKDFQIWKTEKNKEKEIEKITKRVREDLKKDFEKKEVETKVMNNPEKKMGTKEITEYKEIFNKESNIDIDRQFRIAANFAESKGMFKGGFRGTGKAESREFKNFAVDGRFLEFKALGITSNQESDTDYLLSAAELNDVFDPVIFNAINQKTFTWNLLNKEDLSTKGNNQVQFTIKSSQNTSATAYTGNAVNTGNVIRQKLMTKFKKYQVGVEVDGDMMAAARGGPIGDVFAREVRDSTDDLMETINKDLFTERGLETHAQIIGFEMIADNSGNATLYNITRSATNKLSPDSNGDTYINGSSADLSIANLRAAKRQAVREGASLNNLFFIGDPVQGDKVRSIYDAAQRPVPTSTRLGFEGAMTFDGIPFFEDKDCPNAHVFLIDQETYRVAIWVPPTLEMLGKDADSQKGFIKTYFATYSRAPRRLVMIYGNAT